MEYSFRLRKNSDYNEYMNPYYHEYDITAFVHSVLRPGDVFVDAGAHAGSYTLQAAKITGGGGRVISIEPNPENLAYLGLNVLINRLQNVVIVPKAVGEAIGTVTLFYDSSKTAFTSVDRNFLAGQTRPKSFETSLTTIDDIYLECAHPREIRVMKIDTEGNDLNVLIGARRTLSRTRYVITEQNTTAVRQLLFDEGFGIDEMRPSGYLLATNSSVA
jgi:FkbM family methyltransferase